MPSTSNGVQRYFDRIPAQWDALYSHENRFMYVLNRLLRKGLFDRYQLTFQKCGALQGARVLDVGSGTGRYSIEFAKRGAERVVGIDFAPTMVEFSKRIADSMGVGDRCEFIHGDFLEFRPDEQFDIVAALGFFDYIADALPAFERIFALTGRIFVASFPAPNLLWGLQRKIRYEWIKKCPIYSYSRERLEKLCAEVGFERLEIIPLSWGHFLAAYKE